MEVYTNELEERMHRNDDEGMELTLDNVALNLAPVHYPSSSELADFANCKMAVMVLRVDSATAESGNECNLVDAVREAVILLGDEVIVVEEAWNSIIVAVGPNTSQTTGTPVTQMIELARQVVNKVYNILLVQKIR